MTPLSTEIITAHVSEVVLRLIREAIFYYQHLQHRGVIDYSAQAIDELARSNGLEYANVPAFLLARNLDECDALPLEVTSKQIECVAELTKLPFVSDCLHFRAATLVKEKRFEVAEAIYKLLSDSGSQDERVLKALFGLKKYINPQFSFSHSDREMEVRSEIKVREYSDIELLGHRGMMIGPDGGVIREDGISGDRGDFTELILEGIPEGVTEDFEEALSLFSSCADNFWHWITEQLPRLYYAQKAGFNGVYIVSKAGSFVMETLELLGVSKDRIKVASGIPRYRVRKLLVPPKCEASSFLKDYDLYRFLDEKIAAPFRGQEPSKKLFIVRRNSRIVRNEEALQNLVQRYGFTTVCFDGLTLKDQLRLTVNAESIIGPHGAAFTHTLFMPNKSLVVELFSPNYVNPILSPINMLKRHRYYMVTSPNRERNYRLGDDIEAPLEVVEQILDRESKS